MKISRRVAIISTLLAAALLTAALYVNIAPDYMLDAELEKPDPHAFTHGGRPLPGTAQQRAFFVSTLPVFVLELDRTRPGQSRFTTAAQRAADLSKRRQQLVEQARDLLGNEPAQALSQLLDRTLNLELRRVGTPRNIHKAVDVFNQTMAHQGLGFQLDASILRHHRRKPWRVLIASFLVEWVQYYSSGSHALRALRRDRLDSMSFHLAVLGFAPEDSSDALVLMGRIDAWLVEDVLPALAPGARMRLFDESTRAWGLPWITALEKRAAVQLRQELAVAVGDHDVLTELGEAMLERQGLIAAFNAQLSNRGVTVHLPDSYYVDLNRYQGIEPAVLPSQWRQLEWLQFKLEHGDPAAAHRTIRRVLGESVERHEVQHLLDKHATTAPPLPAVLNPYLEPTNDDGSPNALATQTMKELSAYLSELARGKQLVKVNLLLLGRFLFNRNFWGDAECFVALAIVHYLAESQGLPIPELVVDNEIDREQVARIFMALLELPEEVLAHQAAQRWQEIHNKPLPPLRRVYPR